MSKLFGAIHSCDVWNCWDKTRSTSGPLSVETTKLEIMRVIKKMQLTAGFTKLIRYNKEFVRFQIVLFCRKWGWGGDSHMCMGA